MRKNLAVKVFILAIAMVLSLGVLVACGEKDDKKQNSDVANYAIPTDVVVSIDVMIGDELLSTITNDTLAGVTQERVTMTTTDKKGATTTTIYIGYSFKAILAKLDITVPKISAMTCFATDGYKNNLEITTIDNSYITIGVEVDGALAPDASKGAPATPRFISNKNAAHADGVTKNAANIVFNPIAA